MSESPESLEETVYQNALGDGILCGIGSAGLTVASLVFGHYLLENLSMNAEYGKMNYKRFVCSLVKSREHANSMQMILRSNSFFLIEY
jgi:hypothetical protein